LLFVNLILTQLEVESVEYTLVALINIYKIHFKYNVLLDACVFFRGERLGSWGRLTRDNARGTDKIKETWKSNDEYSSLVIASLKVINKTGKFRN